MKLTLILSLYILSNLSFGTETLLLGGGGDPAGTKTIFDDSLRTLAEKKSELHLNINSYFNGGHSETEKILSNEVKVNNQSFTSKNYAAAIEGYIKKIESGEIKPGEKLIVIIDTHGAEKTMGSKTHSIAMSGSEISSYDRLGSNQQDSIDRLFDLSKKAEEKGIRLAILDFSCHSGNSLPLSNKNTCVISSSGPKHFGYSDFPSTFYENMVPGKNLEEVFLQARMNYSAPSFPMISTKAGQEVNGELYGLISPYINIVTENGAADKITPYLNTIFEGGNLCKRESEYSELLKKIEEFQKISGALRSKYYGSGDLIEELKAFKQLQDGYIKKLEDSGLPLLNKIETISYGQAMSKTKKNGLLEEKLSWKEIITQYPISGRDYFQSQLNKSRDPNERRDLKNTVDKFTQIDLKRQEILSKYPTIAQANKSLGSLKSDHKKIWDKASKVSELANIYYDNLYREKSKASSGENNPCRDFSL